MPGVIINNRPNPYAGLVDAVAGFSKGRDLMLRREQALSPFSEDERQEFQGMSLEQLENLSAVKANDLLLQKLNPEGYQTSKNVAQLLQQSTGNFLNLAQSGTQNGLDLLDQMGLRHLGLDPQSAFLSPEQQVSAALVGRGLQAPATDPSLGQQQFDLLDPAQQILQALVTGGLQAPAHTPSVGQQQFDLLDPGQKQDAAEIDARLKAPAESESVKKGRDALRLQRAHQAQASELKALEVRDLQDRLTGHTDEKQAKILLSRMKQIGNKLAANVLGKKTKAFSTAHDQIIKMQADGASTEDIQASIDISNLTEREGLILDYLIDPTQAPADLLSGLGLTPGMIDAIVSEGE